MLNGMNLKILFDSDKRPLGVRRELIPYLVFDYVITTHQFNPSPYYRELNSHLSKKKWI